MKCPHCGMPIDEHEAERETDACVAVAVMDEILTSPETVSPHDRETGITQDVDFRLSHYSSDIAAAWEVWNRCTSQLFSERDRFFTALEDALIERNKEHERGWRIAWPHAMMNLSPLAICRAALKAAGE